MVATKDSKSFAVKACRFDPGPGYKTFYLRYDMEKENVIRIVQCLRQIADILENENAPKDLLDEESFIKQEETPKKITRQRIPGVKGISWIVRYFGYSQKQFVRAAKSVGVKPYAPRKYRETDIELVIDELNRYQKK